MLFLITNQSNCFTLFVLKLGGDTTITAPTQKAGFRVPKIVFWLIKHYFFKLSFVVKATPF